MDERKSERFIVPGKRGNPPEEPRGGRGAPGQRTVEGKEGGDAKLRNRLNETATDSEAGEGSNILSRRVRDVLAHAAKL